jgi:hypothetical protein
MATDHRVKLAVLLTPVTGLAPPEVLISVPGQTVQTALVRPERFEFNFAANTGWIQIQMINKAPTDQHTAVIIDKIEFFGISDPKFVWMGTYTPDYPEPWYSQQQPPPQPQLTNVTYMGWNGAWRLDFDIPVFSWIHQVQNLGWIHC